MSTLVRRASSALRSLVLTSGAVLGVVCLVWTVGLSAAGITPLVFMSGSMAPAIDAGAVGLARDVPAADVRVGDVVSVEAADGTRITHRVVLNSPNGDERMLVLQGDANDSPDLEQYPVTTVKRVDADLPHVGSVIVAASTPWGIGGGLLLVLACLVLAARGVRRGSEPPSAPRHAAPGRARRPRRWALAATAGAGVLALAGGLLAPVVGTLAYFTDSPAVQSSANGLTSAPALACNQNVAAFSPYAYYALDETGSGTTAADTSGNSRAATYRSATGGIAKGASSACGRGGGTAVTFGGALANLNPAYASSNANVWNDNGTGTARWNTFTLSLWFKPTTAASRGKLIGLGNAQTGASSDYDRHLYVNAAGRLVFGVYPGEIRRITSPATYTGSQWRLATATLSPTGMRLYVDGALVGELPGTTSAQQNYTGGTAYWRIAYDNLNFWDDASADHAYAGTLDEVGIWTRALSATEVRDLYRSSLPRPTS